MKDNALMIADALYKDSADMASKAREVVEHCATEGKFLLVVLFVRIFNRKQSGWGVKYVY